MSLYLRTAFILVLIYLMGCVRDIKDLKDFPEDREVIEIRNALKKAKEEMEKAIKKKLEERGPEKKVAFDPWVSPDYRPIGDLPRALRSLPKDKFGNPDWTAAIKRGLLDPIDSIVDMPKGGTLLPDGSVLAEDAAAKYEKVSAPKDILFEINDRLMANVLFPHKVHIYLFTCKVCHPDIFIEKKGANIFTMYDIWDGKYCGRCHGKVAFQPKGFDNCKRCHSKGKKTMGVQ